jgi:hypothetical protein
LPARAHRDAASSRIPQIPKTYKGWCGACEDYFGQERAEVIAAFLTATAGRSCRQLQAETDIPYRVVSRLRTSERNDVQEVTLDRMRALLARSAAA